MNWTFYGGVREVTGSKHILQVGKERILFDCGMFQGRRAESTIRNSRLPFSATSIGSVILSHAHIDHSGVLPVLVRSGFHGPIYATPATCDVVECMLKDTAKIQMADAKFVSKINARIGQPEVRPLYTEKHVQKTLFLLRSKRYEEEFDAAPGIRVRFLDAGHILGSAVSVIEASEQGRTVLIGYAVDLGRKNLPILRDPQPMEGLDYLIIESTYGDRLHDEIQNAAGQLAEVINRTYNRSGKIIIPSFALERTQEIIYILNELRDAGAIPDVRIYVDSPLATDVTNVFRRHPECFDAQAIQRLREDGDLFGYRRVSYLRSVQESKRLNHSTEPCIIIASSGMCESGRVLHHLRNHIQDPATTIIIVGFTAKDTLGRKIAERQPTVRIFGEEHPLRAEVVVFDAFSAHADRRDLIAYAKRTSSTLKGVFVVHGEEEQSLSLANALIAEGISQTEVPQAGETVEFK